MSEIKSDNQFYKLRDAAFLDLEAAEEILREDPASIDAKNSIGETVFHFLAVENAIESVRHLLEQGSNINTTNDFGDTPLSEAAGLGYLEMCRFLLECGADLRIHNQYGNTALAEAAETGQIAVVELLLGYIGDDEDINTHFGGITAMMLLEKESQVVELLKARGLKNPYADL